jgi:hypothetical protein
MANMFSMASDKASGGLVIGGAAAAWYGKRTKSIQINR